MRLLQWLDLLLQESSVSRAALRADITQSAMSHALRQLRLHFNDPLLVRAGRGMRLSPRALALKAPLQESLQRLRQVASAQEAFDPAVGSHSFRLAMPDYGDRVLVPALLRRLARLAPRATLHCVPPDGVDLLEITGRVDLLIGRNDLVPSSLHRRVLWEEDFVVVARAGHPRLRAGGLDLAAYLAESHVLVSTTGLGKGAVDQGLARQGLSRHVACTLSQFASAGRVVAQSELITTLPRRVAQALAQDHALQLLDPPLPLPRFEVAMLWHPSLHQDARHRWLRQQVLAALRDRA